MAIFFLKKRGGTRHIERVCQKRRNVKRERERGRQLWCREYKPSSVHVLKRERTVVQISSIHS